jgi:hypothetical protein
LTTSDHARRRFIDAVIELSDTATPVNVLRYLEASTALDRGDSPRPLPAPKADNA